MLADEAVALPASDPVNAPGSEERKILLCLSGGGFRATLFHLGVVRYLKDAGILSQISEIAAVSGGAFLAAHLLKNWKLFSGSSQEFDQASRPLLELINGGNLRNRFLRRHLALEPWFFACRPLTRLYVALVDVISRWQLTRDMGAEQLAEAKLQARYHPHLDSLKPFFGSGTLRSVQQAGELSRTNTPATTERSESPPDRGAPHIFILATCLNDGQVRAFSDLGYGMGRADGTICWSNRTQASLALAVAASSAFPPAIPPLEVTVRETDAAPRCELLTDGGVFDNLGLEFIRAYHAQKSTSGSEYRIVVSDAGLALTPKATPGRWLVSRNARASEVLMSRVAAFESAAISGADATLVSIRDTVDTHPLEPCLQELIAHIRTDLDNFTLDEMNALLCHGYSVAAAKLAGGVTDNRTRVPWLHPSFIGPWLDTQVPTPSDGERDRSLPNANLKQPPNLGAVLEESSRRRLGWPLSWGDKWKSLFVILSSLVAILLGGAIAWRLAYWRVYFDPLVVTGRADHEQLGRAAVESAAPTAGGRERAARRLVASAMSIVAVAPKGSQDVRSGCVVALLKVTAILTAGIGFGDSGDPYLARRARIELLGESIPAARAVSLYLADPRSTLGIGAIGRLLARGVQPFPGSEFTPLHVSKVVVRDRDTVWVGGVLADETPLLFSAVVASAAPSDSFFVDAFEDAGMYPSILGAAIISPSDGGYLGTVVGQERISGGVESAVRSRLRIATPEPEHAQSQAEAPRPKERVSDVPADVFSQLAGVIEDVIITQGGCVQEGQGAIRLRRTLTESSAAERSILLRRLKDLEAQLRQWQSQRIPCTSGIRTRAAAFMEATRRDSETPDISADDSFAQDCPILQNPRLRLLIVDLQRALLGWRTRLLQERRMLDRVSRNDFEEAQLRTLSDERAVAELIARVDEMFDTIISQGRVDIGTLRDRLEIIDARSTETIGVNRTGVISDVYVKAGDRVLPGDRLFSIRPEPYP